MKIIHTSDWHIGRLLFEYPLLEDQRHFLEQFIRYAADIKADAILLAGDLYNRAVPSAGAVELLDWALSQLVLEHHIPVLAIAGNHDSPQRLAFGARLMRQQGLYIASSPTRRIQSVTLGAGAGAVTFWLLPFFTAASVRGLFPEREILTANDAFLALMEENRPFIDSRATNILIAHGFFSSLGARAAEDAVFSQSELPIGASDVMNLTPFGNLFDYLALGHLHAPQQAGGPYSRYCGSPLKYSLSEARQKKSVTVLTIERKGDIALSFPTFSPLHELRSISGSFAALCDSKNQNGEPLDDYVFANITDDGAILYAMDKLRQVFPNILGLSFAPPEKNGRAALSREELVHRPVDELFCEFFLQVTGSPASPARALLAREIAAQREESL